MLKCCFGTTHHEVLVTGSDGYIGSQLTSFLLARGFDVVGLDTGFYRDGWLCSDEAQRFPVCINTDIRRLSEEDLRGFDAVVHLAELSNDPLGQNDPAVTYEINHLGTVSLAKKCIAAGVPRFVYTSSCSVYGAGDGGGFKTEESAPNPQTAYAQCKVLVERDVAALASDVFSPTFLRNATAYGASARMRFDVVLNNLAGHAWTRKEIRMTSDGTPWRPLVHVLDIAQAVACTLRGPARRRSQPDLQRRLDDGELSGPGDRGDRRRGVCGVHAELRQERRRQPQLPRELRQDSRAAARVRVPVERTARRAASCSTCSPASRCRARRLAFAPTHDCGSWNTSSGRSRSTSSCSGSRRPTVSRTRRSTGARVNGPSSIV